MWVIDNVPDRAKLAVCFSGSNSFMPASTVGDAMCKIDVSQSDPLDAADGIGTALLLADLLWLTLLIPVSYLLG
jgi:hypothetical protein